MIRIFRDGEADLSALLAVDERARDISAPVAEIIAGVRKNGDAALREYSLKFDGATLDALEVTPREWDEAVSKVEPEFYAVMERAAENIARYHGSQLRSGFISHGKDGTVTGQKLTPLERVGLYIPGGTAAYPSSALMNAVPAKLAGVAELVMVTPPGKDGGIKNPYILAAAKIAGIDRVFKLGGAHAVAALAYGTESVPRADKIVGPGNAFVAEAKRQVYGQVGIDMIAGPSDVLVIADDSADPALAAADMLAQAEHDELARAILITTSERCAAAVASEIDAQLESLPRRDIAEKSIARNGFILIADSVLRAVQISNELAPEHLELAVMDAFDYLEQVRNAGSVFLGHNTPEALGDYFAGPNHTLPTMGTARFASPLSVDDFVKKTQFTYFSKSALDKVGADIISFAEREGLRAHGLSVAKRLERGK